MTLGKLDCSYYKSIKFVCMRGHEGIYPVRCRKCSNCKVWRLLRVVWICRSKFELLDPKPVRVFLWTFGTNLEHTGLNLDKLKKFWRLFSQRLAMRRIRDQITYDPFFYVLELGSSGKRLHVHAIVGDHVEHGLLRDLWSDVTGIENPNVNFSCPKICRSCGGQSGYMAKLCLQCGKSILREGSFYFYEPSTAFNYLLKYLSKGIRNYYYLGRFLKTVIPPVPKRTVCDVKMVDATVCSDGIVYKDFSDVENDFNVRSIINKVSLMDVEEMMQEVFDG